MKITEINLRDPFVLTHDGKYYLYGTRGSEAWGCEAHGLDVYVSSDMENWSEPKEIFSRSSDFWATMHYWAPEVYEYNGAFYMFVSFKADGVCRRTQILKADKPDGTFKLHGEDITPEDWECLDGTFYVSKSGTPYIVFSHEWTQVKDGEIWYRELSPDLSKAVGEPKKLFSASSATWVHAAQNGTVYVTDGPFMMRLSGGDLIMLWSSFGESGYAVAIARSDNGEIDGNFSHDEERLFSKDGGHAMVFTANDGQMYLLLHSPNKNPLERPHFFPIKDCGNTLKVI